MPSLTATTTQTITIKSTTKRRLMTALRTYAQLKGERDAIDMAMKSHRGTVEDVLNEVGESSLVIEGFKATLVAPVRKQLDKKRFVALGGDLDILERATLDVAGASYVKVTSPGDKQMKLREEY